MFYGGTYRLFGLRSRCKMKLRCKYSSPCSVMIMYALTLAGVSIIFESLMIFSRSVSMKSNTNETFDLWPNTSNSPIKFSCCNSCNNLISLRAVRFWNFKSYRREPLNYCIGHINLQCRLGLLPDYQFWFSSQPLFDPVQYPGLCKR